jgi:hypothetical protein
VEQTDLLRYAIGVLDRLAIPYVIVGSYGTLAYGEPRTTQDIDIVLQLNMEKVTTFCEAFPPPDFYISEQAVRDAVRSRFQFNVLDTTSGGKIDFIFPPQTPWGIGQILRRQVRMLQPDLSVYIASPEDIILGKLWYHSIGGSDKHLRDIAGILRISGGLVDHAFVTEWATQLGYLQTWETILRTMDGPAA